MPNSPGQEKLFNPIQDLQSDKPIDEWYLARGIRNIAGVDEAGRGALAGPVCAAAVILGESKIDGLNDSKKLSSGIRARLYKEIWEKAGGVGVAMVGPGKIDEINILRAAMEAMKLAVAMLPGPPDLILVDGDRIPSGMDNAVAIVRGDSKSRSIMAASIVAKVTRDLYMIKAADYFPEFGLERHKGYGVSGHLKAIKEFGPSAIHRLSFAPCRETKKPNSA